MWYNLPSFVAKSEAKNYIFVGSSAIGIQCLFLNRAGTSEEKKLAVF